jgi:hypothetical protein
MKKAGLGALLFALLVFGARVASGQATVTVVEYHHGSFDHYFITPVLAEIALLDAHAPPFQDWSRTGFSFNAYVNATAPAGSVAICRFFNDQFAPKSSHFYAPHGLGCEDTLAKFPDWKLEDDKLFNSMLPDGNGVCPAGTVPLYRLYNAGMGAAPNHRFVTNLAERQKMVDQGFVPEGNGIGVGMCVPPEGGAATTAKGIWVGTTSLNQTVRVIILDDGTYYILYTNPASTTDAGVVQGSSVAADGNFSSQNGVNFPIALGDETADTSSPASVSGTYTARGSLQLTLGGVGGTRTLSAAYVPGSDVAPSVAAVAGAYVGRMSHVSGSRPTTFTFDALGRFEGYNDECSFAGTIAPRASLAVFDWTISVTSTKGCTFRGPITGVFYYDETSRQVHGFATYHDRADELNLIGTK